MPRNRTGGPPRPYRSTLTPAERSDLARAAAHERWSRIRLAERTAATEAARAVAARRYFQTADELGITDPVERAKLAANARAAEMCRVRAAKARQARAEAERDAGQAGPETA